MGLVAAVAAFLQWGCVRIYVASPDVFSMREPPAAKIGRAIEDLRTDAEIFGPRMPHKALSLPTPSPYGSVDCIHD